MVLCMHHKTWARVFSRLPKLRRNGKNIQLFVFAEMEITFYFRSKQIRKPFHSHEMHFIDNWRVLTNNILEI